MTNLSFELARSLINAAPLLMITIVVLVFIRAPFIKFISRNLLDSGKDKYSNELKVKLKDEVGVEKKTISDQEVDFKIRKILLNESGKKYFDTYKENVEGLLKQREKELADHALSKVYSEKQIEDAVTESLSNKVEATIKGLIRGSEQFKSLQNETMEKLNLIKTSSFLEHLEKEYDATRSTKALMSNMFMLVNFFYFLGLLGFLIIGQSIVTSSGIYLALSFSYIGLGSFVVYMIKFCNARSLTLLSLREDYLKREQISNLATKMVEQGASEHHVALLQLLNSSVATKEQRINHPYEMLLYGIKDSNIMFKGGKFEIKKESASKPSQ